MPRRSPRRSGHRRDRRERDPCLRGWVSPSGGAVPLRVPGCWWRLPSGIRDTITATHGRDPDSQVEAMLSAIAWYREELPRVPIGDESCIKVVWGRYDDEPESDKREAEQRVLDVARDLFAVLDAHGYQRTSDDAALGRAVVAVWRLVEEYEGQTDSGITRQRPDGL